MNAQPSASQTKLWQLPRSDCQSLECLQSMDEQIAGEAPQRGLTDQQIRRLILVRQLRSSLIGRDLFADPAWDMLLGLYAAELAGARVSTAELCASVDVPLSTASRWITALSDKGFITPRSEDQLNLIQLTPAGSAVMNRYFSTVSAAVLPF